MKVLYFLFFLPIAVVSFAIPPEQNNRQKGVSVDSSTAPLAAERQSYALLVDAENASPRSFDLMMQDLERRCIETPIRRIFGKSFILNQDPWQKIILEHSFIPTYCQGLADMDLALDAMDILYTKDFIQGFVLFSSDADFTRLVQRIRENNLTVLGVGQRFKTNSAETLAKACHEFVYTEDLEMAKQRAIEAKEQREKEEREKLIKKAELEAEEKLRTRERQEALAKKEETKWMYDSMQKAWQAVSRAFTLKKEKIVSLNNTCLDTDAMDKNKVNANSKKKKSIVVTSPEVVVANGTTQQPLNMVVQTLKNELKTLSPNNDWINLSVLTERSSCDVKDTGYKKMTKFIRAQSEHFELKLEKTTYRIRQRE